MNHPEAEPASGSVWFNAVLKRKIVHSVIEKKYPSKIKDGIAELRYCVPSARKGRTSSLGSGVIHVTLLFQYMY
jgi:hypothetical protein